MVRFRIRFMDSGKFILMVRVRFSSGITYSFRFCGLNLFKQPVFL